MKGKILENGKLTESDRRREVKTITDQQKSKKVLQAEEALRQAKARLKKLQREERKRIEKVRAHHKFMMGGETEKGIR